MEARRIAANIAKLPELLASLGWRTMSELLRQVLIAVVFGAYLTGFIVTRNRWRDEMIERGIARYNWQTGKWQWGEPPKSSD